MLQLRVIGHHGHAAGCRPCRLVGRKRGMSQGQKTWRPCFHNIKKDDLVNTGSRVREKRVPLSKGKPRRHWASHKGSSPAHYSYTRLTPWVLIAERGCRWQKDNPTDIQQKHARGLGLTAHHTLRAESCAAKFRISPSWRAILSLYWVTSSTGVSLPFSGRDGVDGTARASCSAKRKSATPIGL